MQTEVDRWHREKETLQAHMHHVLDKAQGDIIFDPGDLLALQKARQAAWRVLKEKFRTYSPRRGRPTTSAPSRRQALRLLSVPPCW